MSYLSKLKREWGYETNVARCATCAAFIPAQTYLIDSTPRVSSPSCKDGLFICRPNAVCTKWHDTDGNTLTTINLKGPSK